MGDLASLHRPAINPAMMMAQQSNLSANFPIPVNNGANKGPADNLQAAHMPAAGMAQAQQSGHYPFSFNGMNHDQFINHLQMRLAQNQQDFVMSRNKILQGQGAHPLLMHQAQDPSQQQLMSTMAASQEAVSHDKNILARRHSLLNANQKLNQQLRKSQEYSDPAAMAQRRNSVPTQMHPAPPVEDMTLNEIDDELLRVKELKLMMMKKKLEAQIDSYEKKK
jgi:hypothetical protein